MKVLGYGFIVMLLLVCLFGCTHSLRSPQHKIALIHSYQRGYSNAERINKLFASELKKNGLQCEIKSYYLNCEKYGSTDEERRISGFIDDSSIWGADLIAVLDDQATYSLMACNHPKIRKIPVVFSGVNYPNMELLQQYPNVTGYIDKPDYLKTCQMIERIMGKVCIHVIKGGTFLDKIIWKDLEKQCTGHNINIRDRVNERILNISPDSLENKKFSPFDSEKPTELSYLDTTMIAKLVSDSVPARRLLWMASGVFDYSLFLYTKRDFTTLRIGSLFDNPGFETINEGFGANDYMLGGYFTPIEIQIKDMAAGIKERLNKKIPGRQLQQCAKQYVVNWVTLEKYKIPEERIPEEYIIMYKPFSKKYSTLILIIKIVVGIFLLLFVSYLIYIYGREKKRKQDALRNLKYEHELLSLAMESGNTYAWRFDGEKAIFDSQFCELIHYDSPQMHFDDMAKFIHPDERGKFLHQVANISDHPKRTAQYRCKFTGEYQWWEFRYKQICHNDNIHIITGLLQNIQEVKDKEEELIQARKVAERAELKQSFLDNMSHEIRTPLNAITGFSNLLTTEKDLSEEEKQEFISIINDNTDLLLKLVNDVLELSRIESGNMSFNYREESVRSLLNSIYNTHQLTISSSLKFIKEFPEGDVFVHIDNMRMTQVITNFLNNAKKFTKSGHIKLGYRHQPASREVHIFVEDTGAGIPKEELQIIFDRFYKHNEFAQGVGLGLSICKVIVGKMQGRIEVTSEINKGSRFTVVLPCL
ncbi:sensor histidine kinase [Bacteroides sp. AM16-15]|mgnify:FL=1|jgi:signal transduction histidine kinase/cbb3-type cytochrome oxidase subunit 3|nr:sensor histidine kinase [Bacteroides sp. AM16-15]